MHCICLILNYVYEGVPTHAVLITNTIGPQLCIPAEQCDVPITLSHVLLIDIIGIAVLSKEWDVV